jgi:hypothetical protein
MVAQTHTLLANDQWYANSGANNHVTNDVANFSLHEPYGGDDFVAIGIGSGLPIQNIGSLTLQTPSSSLNLNRVLHCPTAMANLLSINQFCLDNNCFFILIGSHYFVKDNKTCMTLLEGLSVMTYSQRHNIVRFGLPRTKLSRRSPILVLLSQKHP